MSLDLGRQGLMQDDTEVRAAVSDVDLVASAKRDPRTFAALYRRYVDRVYRYCYRRLSSHQAAEDATSETFLKAFDALPRFRHQSFRGWLFTIAHNVTVDAYRAQLLAQPLDRVADLRSHLPEPDEVVLDWERRTAIRALLDELTDDQREVVELRLAGLTSAEIAQVLGRSHGAVRVLQFRAFARIRRRCGRQGTAEEAQNET